MTAIFISGFSGTAGKEQPGVHKMADMLSADTVKKLILTKNETWTDGDSVIESVKNIINTRKDQPVVLVGHSFGGDTVVEVAEGLNRLGICVDLMIQIDSVGVGDDKKPVNVLRGVNLWNASRKGINGEINVDGSENIPISGTTHGMIDNPGDSGEVRNNPNSDLNGKNGFMLVNEFIGQLMPPYSNQTKSQNVSIEDFYPYLETVFCTIQAAGEDCISAQELQEKTHVELAHLVPALKHLLADGLIETASGPERMEYFKIAMPMNWLTTRKKTKSAALV